MGKLKEKLIEGAATSSSNILKWFRIENPDHLKAAAAYLKNGKWPDGFPPEPHAAHLLDMLSVLTILTNYYLEEAISDFGSWKILSERFRRIGDITPKRSSLSYNLEVYFNGEGKILVTLGPCDIKDWPRNLNLGPFDSEQEARLMTHQKIKDVEDRLEEESYEQIPF